MKVVLTNQSLDRLESALNFYLQVLKIDKNKVSEIKNDLLISAKNLSSNPYKGQYEPHLVTLKKGYRRLIVGNFKIIYRVEGQIIYITDFFDSRNDPKKMKS